MAEISYESSAGNEATDQEAIMCRRFINTNQSNKKLYSSYYGYIYVGKIVNNTDRVVHFYNPDKNVSGDINPGESEENHCKGYIPYWSYINRYAITYYNKALKEEKKILIKDLEGDWLASFYQEGSDEDVRELRAPTTYIDSKITIVLTNSGYDVTGDGNRKGGVLWQPI